MDCEGDTFKWPDTGPEDWCGKFMTEPEYERERLFLQGQKTAGKKKGAAAKPGWMDPE
jgi:hypothetical protein